MSTYITDSFVNDYFLHLVSLAPKHNNTLLKILVEVSSELDSHRAALDGLDKDVQNALETISQVCRGLRALIDPSAPWLWFCSVPFPARL